MPMNTSQLLDWWQDTAEWDRLGRNLALNFAIPAESHIARFCYIARITRKQYDAMMALRASRTAVA